MPATSFQLKLMFHHSQLDRLDGVVAVAYSLASHGFLPADGVWPNIHPVEDVERLVRSPTHHHDYSQDPAVQKYWLWTSGFPIVVEDKPDLIADFGFDYIDARQNRLDIGGLADLEFRDQRHYVEPFAQQLRDLSLTLYPLLRSMLGWVDESFSNETATKDSLKLKLRTISWVNFFGPVYVEKYGQAFLLGLPGYKTEVLPDGGVFHQLSPTFVAVSEKEAKALRRQVVAYCAEHGLKVACRAPHCIPGVSPTAAPEPGPLVGDADIRTYLRQALGATLVLDDGTRVKPIYMPWDDLTPQQRHLALHAIRQAAVAELQRPGRQRIRLEFNAIPDELDQVLVELAGRENPDFEWVQVEMGEDA